MQSHWGLFVGMDQCAVVKCIGPLRSHVMGRAWRLGQFLAFFLHPWVAMVSSGGGNSWAPSPVLLVLVCVYF